MYLPKGKYCVYPRMVYRLAIVMPPPPPFWMTKNNFRLHLSPFQINTQLLYLITKWLPAAILDDRKSLSIAFLAISDKYATFIFFTKWLPAAILDDRKSLSISHFAPFQINKQLLFFFTKWLPAAILDDRKSLLVAFLAISDQYATFIFLNFFSQNGWRPFWIITFLSHFAPFQINTQLLFFTKWLPAAILDDRKSLSIAFLAISDQYATLIFFSTKWLPAAILDDWKSLSVAFLTISDQYTTFFFKMATGGHFGSPICAMSINEGELCQLMKVKILTWICIYKACNCVNSNNCAILSISINLINIESMAQFRSDSTNWAQLSQYW